MISTMRLGVADLPPKPVDSMKLAKRVKRELGISQYRPSVGG